MLISRRSFGWVAFLAACVVVVLAEQSSRSPLPSLVKQLNNSKMIHLKENVTTNPNLLNVLLEKAFKHYNKEALPKRPVIVHMDVLLLKVKSTVEKEGIFESVVALFIEWQDNRITWDPAEFDNLTLLAFDASKVWLPDIAMTNSADHLYSISRDDRFIVRVSADGHFKFVPTGTARTWCDLKLLTFPFDYQNCSLEFESWSLDSSTMTFDGLSHLLVDDSFASNQFFLCEQHVRTYHHTYEFTGETFTRVRFDFTVRRKSTFYIINLIFPCTTLSLIQLLVFWISSRDTTADRIGFGTTNLLTLVVFQTIVTAEMPKTSDAVTALSKYVIALILISALGIFESVFVERMYSYSHHPPSKLMLTLFKYVPLLGLDRYREKRQSSAKNHRSSKSKESTRENNDQHQLPYVITASAIFPIDKLLLDGVVAGQTGPAIGGVKNLVPDNFRGGAWLVANDELDSEMRRTSYKRAISTGNLFTRMDESNLKLNPYGVLTPAGPCLPSLTATVPGGDANKHILGVKVNFEFVRTSDHGRMPQPSDEMVDQPQQQMADGTTLPSSTENSRSSSKQSRAKDVAAENARQWSTIACKVDFIAFTSCAILAAAIPFTLFLPLLDFRDACSDDSSRLAANPPVQSEG